VRMIPRRSLLSAGTLALAGCGGVTEQYFGKTQPPKSQRLTMALEGIARPHV
jgi:hypothetical protein